MLSHYAQEGLKEHNILLGVLNPRPALALAEVEVLMAESIQPIS